MEGLFDLIYKIGEFIIFFILNSFYSVLMLLIFFLINPLLENPMSSYILLFVPLTGLIGLSLERLTIAINEAFNKDKSYIKAYFYKLKDNILRKYLIYVVEISLFYYAISILERFSSLSGLIKVVEFIFIFLYGNIIFYTILQTSLREYVGFINLLKNSVVLTYRYLIISILNTLAIFIFIRLIEKNILFFLVFIFIMAGFINLCHRLMIDYRGRKF